MVLAGYEVVLWVEGAASLLGTGPVEGMGAAVQATANGSTSTLTVSTPAIAIVQCWRGLKYGTIQHCDMTVSSFADHAKRGMSNVACTQCAISATDQTQSSLAGHTCYTKASHDDCIKRTPGDSASFEALSYPSQTSIA